MIALMPTRGTVTAETLMALLNNSEDYRLRLYTENRLAVDVARNLLAERAIESASDPSLDGEADPVVVWIDSDAFFLKGTLTLLLKELQRGAFDVVAPLTGARVPGSSVQALRKAGDLTSSPKPGVDCHAGEIVGVEMVSTHFLMHRAFLLKRLGPQPFGSHDDVLETDDFHFCRRVREAGGALCVHTGVPVFHVDERNGAAFLPGFDPVFVRGNEIDPLSKAEPLAWEARTYGARIDGQSKLRSGS